ncbi:MAG: tungstate ABC transporter substrate-binding protein WtpA [Bacteroidetes bacterium]|nr:MAG: tungstate ABC transporter substrate-binding protein WtpA [Bacteroidota bacterium]
MRIILKKSKQLISILLVLTLSVSCNNTNNKTKKDDNTISGKLVIFHAGSLSVPFKQIATEFNKEYPNVKVVLEPAGSRKCARKITDLNQDCDIMASADYKVINNLLIPDYADWNIKFASNEMAIVYNEKSHYANEINKDNWYKILLKKDVAFGRSDPNSDPCGYRAVLTSKLAEKYYKQNGLAKKLLAKDLNYMRPKEVDLLSLLEANAIDYIYLYRSVAEQHNLKFLILPDSVNLKNPELGEYYSTVSVKVNGRKPGEKITHKGEAMVYGVTILKNVKNKPAAEAFTKFLLNKEKGVKIMEENGQPSVIPSYTSTFDKIQDDFKQFAKK